MSEVRGVVSAATVRAVVNSGETIRATVNTGGTLRAQVTSGDFVIGGGTPLQPATTTTLGGIIVGDDLLITQEGRLSVDKATNVEQDNTRPITAAAVYTEVGNINALLATI